MNNILQIPMNELIPAEWNYKTDGTPEQITKLAESIKHDNSAGVLAVRKVEGNYEVIDGNHRLKAIQQIGWESVPCEDFGWISKAEAILISRRRNFQWFEDDTVKFAQLFKDFVLPDISIEEMEKFMPETREELENLEKLLVFDWDQFQRKGKDEDDELVTIKFALTPKELKLWQLWSETVSKNTPDADDTQIFILALLKAMKIKHADSAVIIRS